MSSSKKVKSKNIGISRDITANSSKHMTYSDLKRQITAINDENLSLKSRIQQLRSDLKKEKDYHNSECLKSQDIIKKLNEECQNMEKHNQENMENNYIALNKITEESSKTVNELQELTDNLKREYDKKKTAFTLMSAKLEDLGVDPISLDGFTKDEEKRKSTEQMMTAIDLNYDVFNSRLHQRKIHFNESISDLEIAKNQVLNVLE